MAIVTIGMIVELNKLLEEQQQAYKIHLSDACGGQSMWIEALNDELLDTVPAQLIDTISGYFASQHMTVEFSPDKHACWIKK